MRRPQLLLLLVVAALAAAAAPASASPLLAVGADGRVTTRPDPFLPAPDRDAVTGPGSAGVGASAARPCSVAPAPPSVPAPGLRARAAGDAVQGALRAALASRRLSRADAAQYRADLARARSPLARLSGFRRAELASVLAGLGSIAARGQLTPSRMPVLFLQLRRNAEYWPSSPTPKEPVPSKRPCAGKAGLGGARVTFAGDPVIFQWYRGRGLQFQPLANFGKANALYAACRRQGRPGQTAPCEPETLRALLDRLVALASTRGSFTTWEYFFAFSGGTPPWTSGISHGTAIQALSRGTLLLKDRRYLRVARRAIGAYDTPAPSGLRVRGEGGGAHYLIYSFAPGLRVLNAFLQALVGLRDYAQVSGDRHARRLYALGDRSARREIPAFDTGAWSLYARGGQESDRGYHELVRDFMARLCDGRTSGVYCTTAARFTRYLAEAPRVALPAEVRATPRRAVRIGFGLSKVSCVTVRVTRGDQPVLERTLVVGRGRPGVMFTPPAVGRYAVSVLARDLADNTTTQTGTVRAR